MQAQFRLGLAYATGSGVEGIARNPAEALKWYRKAADQGHKAAQYQIGIDYMTGNKGVTDYALAEKYLKMAAAQGRAGAKEALERAQRMQRAADAPSAASTPQSGGRINLDMAMLLAGVAEGNKTSLEKLRALAKQGDARAQERLPAAETSFAAVQNRTAANIARAERGDAEAQVALGKLRQLIAASASMSAKERQEWLTLLPKMGTQQIARLTEVLETEKRKLEALDRKYQQDIKALNEKYAK